MGHGRGSNERTPFLVEVAALRRSPGSARRVEFSAPLSGLSVPTAGVDEGAPVRVEVLLESVSGGILVTGTVRAPWTGSCRRCLEEAHGELCVEVAELCVEVPDEEDTTYRLDGDVLDLAPIVTDACILDLPLAPLCFEGCLGICPECGVNRNVERCACASPADPRWGALAALSSEGERPEELR